MNAITTDRVRVSATKLPPLIVDLGRVSKKKVRQLKNGQGIYWEEVEPVITDVKAKLGKEAEGKEIFPVIVIYEKKAGRKKLFDILG